MISDDLSTPTIECSRIIGVPCSHYTAFEGDTERKMG